MTATEFTNTLRTIALGRTAVTPQFSDRSTSGDTSITKRGGLVRKYFIVFGFLVSLTLIVSGVTEIYFRYTETQRDINRYQGELATRAAMSVAQFILTVEDHLKAAAVSAAVARGGVSSDLHFELARLLAIAPAINEVVAIDDTGTTRAYASRFRAFAEPGGDALSRSPSFIQAKQGVRYFGPVSFEHEIEPFMIVAVPIEQFPGRVIGVLQAKISLNQIAEVMRELKFSMQGYGYITNRAGEMIAHSDPGMMLQRSRLANLPQVQAAFQANPVVPQPKTMTARNLDEDSVLAAFIFLPNLDWTVFVEQPLSEAHRDLYNSLFRTSAILIFALGLTLLASVLIARRVVRPLEILGAGVQRVGQGDLNYHLQIKTGDEMEILADEFNKMRDALKQSYQGLESKIQQRTKEIGALSDISSIATRSLDTDDVMQQIAAKISEILELDNVRIYAFGQNEEKLRQRAVAGIVSIDVNLIAPFRGKGLVARVAESGEAFIFEDIENDPTYAALTQNSLSRQMGFRFFALFPIKFKSRVLGVVVCNNRAPRKLSEQEHRLLTSMADQIGPAFENLNLFDALRRQTTALESANHALTERSRELSAMYEITATATHSLELAPVLQRVSEKITEILDYDAARIYLIDRASRNLELRAVAGQHRDAFQYSFKIGTGILGVVAARGEAVIFNDIQNDPHYIEMSGSGLLKQMGFRFLAIFPIKAKNQLLGTLSCCSMNARVLSAGEIRLTQSLIDQLGPVIEKLNLYRQLEENSARIENANRQLKELDRLKSGFLSNVSHELRTPLTAIGSFADNMLDGVTGNLTDKQSRYVTGIKDSSERLTRLINDLLDLSVIESGRIKLEPGCFCLSELVHEVAATMIAAAQAKAITLDLPSVNGNHMAWADRDRIIQVLTNLISNAIKFTPKDGRVSVAVDPVDEQTMLSVCVSDSGPGIPESERVQIFDEFYQISQPGEEKAKGVGLGLAISKRLVEMNGGKISVRSTQDAGSTFTFTVPTYREHSITVDRH